MTEAQKADAAMDDLRIIRIQSALDVILEVQATLLAHAEGLDKSDTYQVLQESVAKRVGERIGEAEAEGTKLLAEIKKAGL